MKRRPLDIDVMLVASGFLYLGINVKNVLLDKMQRKNIVLVGIGSVICFIPVSYTHLDVYKRQVQACYIIQIWQD